MWKPGEVVPQHRGRAVAIWTVLIMAIITYTGWLLYKAAEKMKSPNTSFALSNVVYQFPDVWVCPYEQYGCDSQDLEAKCVDSAWDTEKGTPNAIFYPNERTGKDSQTATEELPIEASLLSDDLEELPRGLCVKFKTSAADAFVGKERDPDEYLDYILVDMYWYPGGEAGDSTTCVADGEEWEPHREWVYIFLSDPEDPTMVSTGIQVSYSCITATSDSHVFNQIGIGLTEQLKYSGPDITSYKALSTNTGVYKDKVNATIVNPYAYLTMEIKQQFDSWEIVTDLSPFEFAEMLGNIGGFWDLLLILWPIFFVAATRDDPRLKPRNFTKSIARGAERVAGVTNAVAHPWPVRRSNSVGKTDRANVSCLEEGLSEEQSPWDPPSLNRQASVARRASSAIRALQPEA